MYMMCMLGCLACLPVCGQNLSGNDEEHIATDTYYGLFNDICTPMHGTSYNFLPGSPQAGSLGRFGQVPVGNFTGTAEITIPVYKVEFRDLSVPITLNYHASGNKPDLFPGPVGLGWALNAGGVITRVIKGESDMGPKPPYPGFLPHPDPVGDPRSEDSWASDVLFRNLILTTLSPEMEPQADPDEYYFNIGGKCGRFYVHPDGTFSVRSADGSCFRVETERGNLAGNFQELPQTCTRYFDNLPEYSRSVEFTDIVKRFTLTDEKGVKYTFGGSLSSIEFSRPGQEPNTPLDSGAVGAYIQPMSWYLVSMEAPEGYKIQLDYVQRTYIDAAHFSDMCLYRLPSLVKAQMTVGHRFPSARKYTLINGCYLSRITFPGGRVELVHSVASGQLMCPSAASYSSPTDFVHFHDYPDVCLANTASLLQYDTSTSATEVRNRFLPYKVDSVKVFGGGKLVRCCRLNYTNSTATRLKLTSVVMGAYGEKQQYSFRYNTRALPDYYSDQTDHYGYCNGVWGSIFSVTSDIGMGGYVMAHPGCWDSLKELKSGLDQQAEMLQEVHYPTGGYTRLTYENHEYGCKATAYPFGTEENGTAGNLKCGGLRIKSIRNYDAEGGLLTERVYHYVKNYADGGTTSSGVLCYRPQYELRYENIRLWNDTPNGPIQPTTLSLFHYFSSNPIFPLSTTEGSHVTYSEVTVEEPGNGFTVHTYKNHDNGYPDRAPVNRMANTVTDLYGVPTADLSLCEPGQSLSLERGQPLSERVYDAEGTLKRQTEYSYRDDEGRFQEGVRYIHFAPTLLDRADQMRSRSISAGLHYTYFPWLKEKRVTEYGNVPLTHVEHYVYTDYRRRKSIAATDSRGRTFKTVFHYPFEKSDSLHSVLTAQHRVDYPIQVELFVDDAFRSRLTTEYAGGLCPEKRTLILPHKVKRQLGGGTPFTETTFERYTMTGLPVDILRQSGQRETYLWKLDGTQLLACINGTTAQQLQNAVGTTDRLMLQLGGLASEEAYRRLCNKLLLAGVKGTLVTTFTHSPLNGLASQTDTTGETTWYTYDPLGRLTEVYRKENGTKQLINLYFYNYAH